MVSTEQIDLNIEEMLQAHLERGRIISKTHPKMRPFIAGVRTPFYIIDLEKTKEKFLQALKFIKTLVEEGKVILVVETRPPFRKLVEEFAQKCSLPYVNFRWIGGTLTNFQEIKKRVDLLKLKREEKTKGIWEKYTKKEKRLLERKLEKLEKKFSGLISLEKLPDAILLLNTDKDHLAIKEARKKNIKIIAVCDTNSDPTQVDFPIPASNNSIPALSYILDKIEKVILNSKNVGENQATKKTN